VAECAARPVALAPVGDASLHDARCIRVGALDLVAQLEGQPE
jgi:hypothetical protein